MIAAAALALVLPLAPLVGGDAFLVDGRRCVAGFNARVVATGAHRVVTSGACTGSGRAVEVVAPPAGATSSPYVRGPGGSLVAVRGATSAPVGAVVCASGPVSGWRCGVVQAKNVTVTFPGGTMHGLTRASLCSAPSDAGGPVMAGDQAQGVVVGASGNCASGGTTYFSPVVPTLSAYGLVLHTA